MAVIDQTQIHFAQLVDALEEGDIERAAIYQRLFNEISGDALIRFNLEQLVEQMYVKEQDVLRMHALHEAHDA